MQDVADEQVVDEHAQGAPDQRPDDGYPEVVAERDTCHVVAARQGQLPPSREEREQPGPEVAGRVNGISGVRAVGHPDRRDREADGQRREVGLDGRVPQVNERHHEDQQERRADDLVNERPGHPSAEVLGGERGEDRVGRECRAAVPRGTRRGVERVDRVVVHEEDQGGADEAADQLSAPVGQDLGPAEFPSDGEGQGHRRVDVGAAHPARHPDGEGDRHRPSPGDQQPVPCSIEDGRGGGGSAGARQPGHGHRHHTVAERDENETSHELGEEFAVQPGDASDRPPFTSQRSDISHDALLPPPSVVAGGTCCLGQSTTQMDQRQWDSRVKFW